MALYSEGHKFKINLNGIRYKLNLYTEVPIINEIGLLSLDNYLLKDSTGICLLPKIEIEGTIFTTIDNYILKDIDGLYITAKENK